MVSAFLLLHALYMREEKDLARLPICTGSSEPLVLADVPNSCVLPYSVVTCSLSIAQNTVKPVLSGHSKEDQRLVFETDYCLLKVKSIAECSKRAFCNTFALS